MRATDREFKAASSDVPRAVPLDAVPWLIATHDDILVLPLDGRAGFVVSLVDGRCTVEMILNMAGLHEDEATAILARLRQLRVIELRHAAGAVSR